MEYIVSRGFTLPNNQKEMEKWDWYSMWRKKNFPYDILSKNDILYWYDRRAKLLVWKTRITKVERYNYTNKDDIFNRYNNPWGKYHYESKPEKGFFLGYKIKVIEQICIPKPLNFNFPRLGWLSGESNVFKEWLKSEDNILLDDLIRKKDSSVSQQLVHINEIMQGISPEKIKKSISTTLRKDAKIVKALKKAANYKCQFPDCTQEIKMANNKGLYIEVAHIEPVKKGGKSVLGNLLVLCPNHHKEFDLGEREIDPEQNLTKCSGKLNGKSFVIKLPGIKI